MKIYNFLKLSTLPLFLFVVCFVFKTIVYYTGAEDLTGGVGAEDLTGGVSP